MVHIGCGADVIRQRRRADQLKKDNEAKGIYTIPPDFKPAKNKKYPYYTPLRKADIFTERQQLSFIRKKAIYCVEQRSRSAEVNPRRPRNEASFQRRRVSSPLRSSLWKTRFPSSSLRGNSYSDSSSVSSNQSPARPIKGQLMRQGAFDELAASFSGQSSCSDELIVCNSTNLTTSMNTKAKRKVLFKSMKVSVTRN